MYCEKCKQFRLFLKTIDYCKCVEFTVINEDEESHKINALDAEESALIYAVQYNGNGDLALMNTNMEIRVETQNGEVLNFDIGAEASIDYSVTEI